MNIRTVIITLTVFVLGGLVGFFISGRITKQRITKVHRIAMDGHGHEAKHLHHMLELSEEQKDEIMPILEEHLPKQRELRKQHKLELDSMRKKMFKEMQPHLTPEQLEKLRKRRKHMRHQHREFTHPHKKHEES